METASCVTLDRLIHVGELHFSHLYNAGTVRFLTRVLWRPDVPARGCTEVNVSCCQKVDKARLPELRAERDISMRNKRKWLLLEVRCGLDKQG